jgi:hypothetical protein
MNNVSILISDIIKENSDKQLLLDRIHPTTFLFLEIIKKICIIMNIDFFTETEYNFYMKNINFVNLTIHKY